MRIYPIRELQKSKFYRFIVACVVSLTLTSCVVHNTPHPQPQYQTYVPPPDANVRIQFEYPINWHVEEETIDDFTDLMLCKPWPREIPTPVGRYGRCSDVISVATYLTYTRIPDLETAITLALDYEQTTPDYALVRRSITVGGRAAQRIELCFNPGGYNIPDPPPQIRHEVYFQIGQRIYEIDASSDFVGRPCNPSAARFPEFEHLLETLVILNSAGMSHTILLR
jgi:hypothetical protein